MSNEILVIRLILIGIHRKIAFKMPAQIQKRENYREFCSRCLKSQVTCYCTFVKPVRTKLKIVLLQHPSERKKAIGTARMTHFCIEDSRLITGKMFQDDAEVNRILGDSKNHCVILFPGPHAKNISQIKSEETKSAWPADKKLVVFVIDGTWAHAKSILRNSPNLHSVPQICFTPKKKSEYKIRKQPASYCLSTIEAVYEVLSLLESDVDADILLTLFRGMVNQQILFQEEKKRFPKNL